MDPPHAARTTSYGPDGGLSKTRPYAQRQTFEPDTGMLIRLWQNESDNETRRTEI